MARTMRRETAMIEPEYARAPGERRGFLSTVFRLLVGLVAGVCAAAYIVGTPGLWGQLRAMFDTQIIANLPDEYQAFAPWVALVLAVLLLLILRRFILNGIVYAAVVGAFLWVPFGNHMLAGVPQVEASLPQLRGEMDRLLGSSAMMTQLRTVTENAVPVAMVEPLIAEAPTVAAPAAE